MITATALAMVVMRRCLRSWSEVSIGVCQANILARVVSQRHCSYSNNCMQAMIVTVGITAGRLHRGADMLPTSAFRDWR